MVIEKKRGFIALHHGASKRSAKKALKTPEVFIDGENDFAPIRLNSGIEAKSYEIIEIQILNLSSLAKPSKKSA